MQGKIFQGMLELHLHGRFLFLDAREISDDVWVFPGGSIALINGEIVGGITTNTRRMFFKGNSLQRFEVVPRVYRTTNLPPYSGIRIEDEWKVRLYEPTTFMIPHRDVFKGRTKIKDIHYIIEEGSNMIKLKPLSNRTFRDDYN